MSPGNHQFPVIEHGVLAALLQGCLGISPALSVALRVCALGAVVLLQTRIGTVYLDSCRVRASTSETPEGRQKGSCFSILKCSAKRTDRNRVFSSILHYVKS